MTSLLMNPPKNKKILPPQEIAWDRFLDDTQDTDEPPAWHAIVLEERAEEWKNPEKHAKPFDEAMEELRAELSLEFSKRAKFRES